jgi:2-phosphosulfolactate phosphatase
MSVLIDAYLTPFFPEPESLFNGSIVVMIDVLRASSTVAAALQNGAKEVITADSLEKAVKIYASLSKEVRFLGGERNGLKPSGFDAGNSPFEYTQQNVMGKSVIFTSSNGTRIFQKAKTANYRIIGGFINLSVVTDFVVKKVNTPEEKISKVLFLCAGNDGNLSNEDMLCAGSFISLINSKITNNILTDSATASMQLFNLHSKSYIEFLKQRDHSVKLTKLGFSQDIEYCLKKDACPIVPLIGSSSIKIA